MRKESDTTVRHGSANVFADLGYADPDTHLLKAHLVSRLIEIIGERQLTRTQAARTMGISQPGFRDCSRGNSAMSHLSGPCEC